MAIHNIISISELFLRIPPLPPTAVFLKANEQCGLNILFKTGAHHPFPPFFFLKKMYT